jgi:hypothetical protein
MVRLEGRDATRIGLLHELLCSVNLAFAAVWVASEVTTGWGPVLIGKLAHPVSIYLFPLVRRFYYSEDAFLHGYLFLLTMCLPLAAAFFVLLRILKYFSKYFSPLGLILLASTGIASVSAFPLSCLWLRARFQLSASATLWLLLEVATVAIAIVLFLYRKRLVPWSFGIVLLTLHFGLWTWLSGAFGAIPLWIARSYGFWDRRFWCLALGALLFPIIGFLASLSWGLYIGSPDGVSGET